MSEWEDRHFMYILGKGVGNMGSQWPSHLCSFASMTSTTWHLFIGEVLDVLFLEQDHIEVFSEVWTLFQILSGVGLGPHSLYWK